jgi:hypothetical protein
LRGSADSVSALLDREDVDINQVDEDEHTPLWAAIGKGHEQVVKRLLENPKLKLSSSSENPEVLFRHAAQSGSQSIVGLLLDKDLHRQCSFDCLFDVAMDTENTRLADFLLDGDADSGKRDQHGWPLKWMTSLNLAADKRPRIRADASITEFKRPTRWSATDKSNLLKIHGKEALTISYNFEDDDSMYLCEFERFLLGVGSTLIEPSTDNSCSNPSSTS